MQTDICLHLHREFLRLPLFESISNGGLRCLSSRIQTCYCAPSENIIYEGELYHPLYFVASGTLQVLRNDVVVAILGKLTVVIWFYRNGIFYYIYSQLYNIYQLLGHGDLLGEYPYQNNNQYYRKSNGIVKALTYCDLRYINHYDLRNVIESYPEIGHVFENQWNLAYNLGEEDVSICIML